MKASLEVRGLGQFGRVISHHTLLIAGLVPLLLVFLLSLLGMGNTWHESPKERVVIDPGSVIEARLNQPLSSRTARVGEVFTGHVVTARQADGSPLGLAGAQVVGRCVAVRKGSGQQHPGYVRLVLESIQLGHGLEVSIETNALSEWTGKVNPPPETSEGAGVQVAPGAGAPEDVIVGRELTLRFVVLEPAHVG